jgi:hypothetical protein
MRGTGHVARAEKVKVACPWNKQWSPVGLYDVVLIRVRGLINSSAKVRPEVSVKLKKNPFTPLGIQTQDFEAFSMVPELTTLPRALESKVLWLIYQ